MENKSPTIGNYVRAEIIRRNYTMSDVATAIGMPLSTFSRKLTGKRDFQLHELYEIAKYLNMEKMQELLPALGDVATMSIFNKTQKETQ